MKTKINNFECLTAKQIWQIFKARAETFIVEQQWLSCEIDDKDLHALHLTIWDDDEQLIGYMRIYSEQDMISFGRVLVLPNYRGKKYGNYLLTEGLKAVNSLFPDKNIIIHAQYRLLNFYKAFGFKPISEVYDDDGIDHITMLKNKNLLS